jgi:hypothetical protein
MDRVKQIATQSMSDGRANWDKAAPLRRQPYRVFTAAL